MFGCSRRMGMRLLPLWGMGLRLCVRLLSIDRMWPLSMSGCRLRMRMRGCRRRYRLVVVSLGCRFLCCPSILSSSMLGSCSLMLVGVLGIC